MTAPRKPFRRFVDSRPGSEARHVISSCWPVRGLMPLLMKSRNGSQWSTEEKAELLASSAARRASRPTCCSCCCRARHRSCRLMPRLDRRRDRRPDAERGTLPLPDSQRQ